MNRQYLAIGAAMVMVVAAVVMLSQTPATAQPGTSGANGRFTVVSIDRGDGPPAVLVDTQTGDVWSIRPAEGQPSRYLMFPVNRRDP